MAAPPVLLPMQTSLYVGDLDPEVTVADLDGVFFPFGPISSIRLCRCSQTGKSLCYGYVNFITPSQAFRAMEYLNHRYLKGKPMRLMWSQRNPSARKSGVGNLFVKNLDAKVNSSYLQIIFSKFGSILSCKVEEENGKSKGFGFVQFASEDSALAARTALHDTMLEGKKLYVSKFVGRNERTKATSSEEPNCADIFVKNLDLNMNEDALRDMFSAFGKVSNVVIMKDQNGKSKGFGFVNFESAEDARKAASALNGSKHGSQTLYVTKAERKAQRSQFCNPRLMLRASNLYVKNLESHIDENELRGIFSPWGNIVSVKVMRHNDGTSKGFGFVCFSTPEEAIAAAKNLNGSLYGKKYLYVAIAQRKKDRELLLQKYFSGIESHQTVRPPNSPLFSHFPPWPVPSFSAITSNNFGEKMSYQCPPLAQVYDPFLAPIVYHGKASFQGRDTSPERVKVQSFFGPGKPKIKVIQGCRGNAITGILPPVMNSRIRHRLPLHVLQAERPGSSAEMASQMSKSGILSPVMNSRIRHRLPLHILQAERPGSSAEMASEMSKSGSGLQHDGVQVVTEDNSCRTSSTSDSA